MGEKDYLQLATDFSIRNWNFDIVKPAGEDEGWFYFSCTSKGNPRWSSLHSAIRINHVGNIEVLEDFQTRRVISNLANRI